MCVSTDYVHIIEYYCYSSYDLTQASSVNKVPAIQNLIFLYYRMYTYDDSALPYSLPVDIILLYLYEKWFVPMPVWLQSFQNSPPLVPRYYSTDKRK